MSVMMRRAGPVGLAAVLVIALATPAWAHTGEESTKATVLVGQAIALIVNTPKDTMAIEDKITDALNSKDTEGVNLQLVTEARDTLDGGSLHRVRALLEVSIGAKPHMSGLDIPAIGQTGVPPTGAEAEAAVRLATGEDTGTNVAVDPLVAQRRFDAGTWIVLAVLAAVAATGIVLSLRFRPPVPLRALRASARQDRAS